MKLRITVLAALAAFALTPDAAAQTVPTARPFRNAAGQVQDGTGVTLIGPMAATSTTTNGTVATANTFQSVLAANTSRLGCAIYNTSASATLLLFLGAPGSATAANSIPLAAGGSFNCGSFQGLVLTDQVSVTSATQGSTFVVVAQ